MAITVSPTVISALFVDAYAGICLTPHIQFVCMPHKEILRRLHILVSCPEDARLVQGTVHNPESKLVVKVQKYYPSNSSPIAPFLALSTPNQVV